MGWRVPGRSKELPTLHPETPEPGLAADLGQWQELIENVSDLIQSVRPDGSILFVNRAWCQTLGYRREEAAELCLFGLFHPDSRKACRKLFERVLAGEKVCRAEATLIAKDGHTVDVEFSSICRLEDGRPYAVQSILHDITERKRAHEALSESESRFRVMADSAPVMVWMSGLDKGCNYFNKGWLDFTGRTLEQEFGNGWAEGVHPDDFQRCLDLYLGSFDARRPFRMEYRLKRHSGEYCWILDTGVPRYSQDGVFAGYIGSCVDISDRRRAEEERRQHEAQMQHVQKLESLGVLAGGIAHDFNNLLTSMLGYSSLALMQLPIESVACPMLYEIEQAARRAAELTQQMLAYSGKGKFVIQRLGLDTLVHEMAKLLETVVSKKAILRMDLEPSVIEGDATQIRQIVMNLITNASDSLEGRVGVIHIRTGLRHLEKDALRSRFSLELPAAIELPAGIYAYVEVEDDGCGMSEETLAKIFDPFFTTKFTGRGLGLAAVLGIVRGHGGAIQLVSKKGEGTRFQIFFPRALAPAEAPRPPQAEKTKRGQGKVLIVEDEAAVRVLARRVLESAGFEVLEAADGEEGLEVCRQNAGNLVLVLLDLLMPKLDGAETLEQLRRLEPGLPVLVMSGYSEQDVATRCAGLGASGFLQKPFEARQLIGRICELLPIPAGSS